MSFLLRYWQLALAGLVAAVGASAVWIYHGEAVSARHALVAAEARRAIADSAIRQQNQAIAILQRDLARRAASLRKAEAANRITAHQTRRIVIRILRHPLAPTCPAALDYLRSQAPSLSH